MDRVRLSASVVIVAAAAIGCGSDDVSAVPTTADCRAGGPILAFTRTGDDTLGGAEVVVVGSDGEVDLATGDWVATRPAFSPDGRELVVVRADGDYESAGPAATSLWRLNADGSDPRALTDAQLDDHPAWSPDGSTIAFSRYATSGDRPASRIMTVPAVGGEATTLLADGGVDDTAPAWAPDGRTIAFIRASTLPDGNRTTAIWVVGADGAGARLVAPLHNARSLDWHPDGNLLVASTFTFTGGLTAVVDVESGDVRPLDVDTTFAAWSPDGTSIAYFAKVDSPESDRWRLVRGRVVGDRLEPDGDVGDIEERLYPQFGLDVSPCASAP